MPRIGRVKPTCHPELPHRAKGLCYKCYYGMRRMQPEMAREVMDPSYFIPVRTPLPQRAVTSFPITDCDKCHSTLIRYEGREARCFKCGYGVWLVRDMPVETTLKVVRGCFAAAEN